LKELVQKFVPEAIGREIEKAARSIYPLQNVYVHKAKILKSRVEARISQQRLT